MKIYILGINYDQSPENQAICQEAVQQMQKAGVNKKDIVNPANIPFAADTSWTQKKQLRLDIINTCTAVYVLRGWKKNIEAGYELNEVQKMLIPIYWEECNDIQELELHVATGALSDVRFMASRKQFKNVKI